PFNLAAPNPLPQKKFADVIGKVLGRPSYFPTPAFLLRLVLGEMSMLVVEGQRVVPQRQQEAGYEFRFPNLEGALRDLLD
ncbi:MAG: DUF1731 domain-containing protein, partial [Chloroflexota bacterium]|nr:DUF1731 domain-containing protein [Chloroflexota bacterium]